METPQVRRGQSYPEVCDREEGEGRKVGKGGLRGVFLGFLGVFEGCLKGV